MACLLVSCDADGLHTFYADWPHPTMLFRQIEGRPFNGSTLI